MTKTLISTIPAEILNKLTTETSMELVSKAEDESVEDAIALYELKGEDAAVTYVTALFAVSALFSHLDNETIAPSVDFNTRWAIGLWDIGIKNAIIRIIGRAFAEDARTGGKFLEENQKISIFLDNQETAKAAARKVISDEIAAGWTFEAIFMDIASEIKTLMPESEN